WRDSPSRSPKVATSFFLSARDRVGAPKSSRATRTGTETQMLSLTVSLLVESWPEQSSHRRDGHVSRGLLPNFTERKVRASPCLPEYEQRVQAFDPNWNRSLAPPLVCLFIAEGPSIPFPAREGMEAPARPLLPWSLGLLTTEDAIEVVF